MESTTLKVWPTFMLQTQRNAIIQGKGNAATRSCALSSAVSLKKRTIQYDYPQSHPHIHTHIHSTTNTSNTAKVKKARVLREHRIVA